MNDAEHRAAIKFACEHTAHRVPVIAGTGSNDTAYAIALSQYAESVGADGLLLVTPYYNKCTQAGLIAHYTAAADTLPCPVIVYNVPSRTGVDVSVETCRVLAGHPNIGGIKEASGSVPKAAHILDACGDELPIWSGNDDLTVPLLSLAIPILPRSKPFSTMKSFRQTANHGVSLPSSHNASCKGLPATPTDDSTPPAPLPTNSRLSSNSKA